MTTRTRYCGSVKMNVTLTDGDFFCVSFPRSNVPNQDGIRLSSYFQQWAALDCSEAFDEVARAALAFVPDSAELLDLDYDADGNAEIRRTAKGPTYTREGFGLPKRAAKRSGTGRYYPGYSPATTESK